MVADSVGPEQTARTRRLRTQAPNANPQPEASGPEPTPTVADTGAPGLVEALLRSGAETRSRVVGELQRFHGNARVQRMLKPTSGVLQRSWTMPFLTNKSNADLIKDGVGGSTVAIKEITNFGDASEGDRFKMIDVLLGQTWVGPRDERALEDIWKSFGAGFTAQASSHLDVWKKCVARDSDLKSLPEIQKMRTDFPNDVKQVVTDYLFANRTAVMNEMEQYGFPAQANQPMTDPNEAQQEQIKNLQLAAAAVAKLQKAQEKARDTYVGYQSNVSSGPMGGEVQTIAPVRFDPFHPPEMRKAPEGLIPGTAIIRMDDKIADYDAIKKAYDDADVSVQGLLSSHPELYAIARENKSATTTDFANTESPAQARQQLATSMRKLFDDIEGAQKKLDSGKLDPLDLIPIHAQLTAGKPAASGTSWKDGLEKSVVSDLQRDHDMDRALVELGLDLASTAAFLLAPFTGGASLFIMLAGVAAVGAKAAMSSDRYEALAQASKTSVLPGTKLVQQDVVDEAQMIATADQIALALAVLAVGMAAAGEALGAIKGPPGGRVTQPVAGLFQSIDPAVVPKGWSIVDGPIRIEGEFKVLRTEVTAPDGSTGWIERAYNPKTNAFEMRNAFLEKLPSWIEGEVPMVKGKGTPTVTYLTLRQMKVLGGGYGNLTSVKMSTIQNVKAVMQLEQLRRQGVDLNTAVMKTHSVQYAETAIIQSGNRIVSAEVTGGTTTPINDMLDWFERGSSTTRPPDPDVVAKHDAMLKEYGLQRTDPVLWDYNVELKVAPAQSTAPSP